MCLYPRLIKNRKYTSNKKNGGVIPAIKDERVLYVPVGCGKCMECMKRRKREWQVRLLEEVKEDKTGKFITLTFSNESIKELSKEVKGLTGYERDNEIATIAVRRFLERWRKKHKKSIKHWLITELGHAGTENIHLHGILWTNESLDKVEKYWKYGWIWKGNNKSRGRTENYVNEKTVNYITKYVQKVDEIHKEYKAKVLTTAGIGKTYINSEKGKENKFKGEKTREYYRTNTGHKMGLTTYWRNNIYSDEEKEKLWLNILDKNIRYVGGIKIDISKGEEEYYKVLEMVRKKNKRLGYGDDKVNWERKEYENQRREMLHKKRIGWSKEVEEKKLHDEMIDKWNKGRKVRMRRKAIKKAYARVGLPASPGVLVASSRFS